MNFCRKQDIMEEQRHIIGIEPVMDMKNFALLLLADLARKSKTHYSDNQELMTACLPLNYCEIIEKIMYEENGWGIKFAELIDIYSYYECQSDWEQKLGIIIAKVIKEEVLNSNLILEHNYIEIQFTKVQVEEIRNRFDNKTLIVMDHFSNLLNDNIFTRSWQVANKESDRHMNRLRYETDTFNDKRFPIRKPII